eukprot:30865-Pelagococcus_subviridis.AAC.3
MSASRSPRRRTRRTSHHPSSLSFGNSGHTALGAEDRPPPPFPPSLPPLACKRFKCTSTTPSSAFPPPALAREVFTDDARIITDGYRAATFVVSSAVLPLKPAAHSAFFAPARSLIARVTNCGRDFTPPRRSFPATSASTCGSVVSGESVRNLPCMTICIRRIALSAVCSHPASDATSMIA